MPCKLCQRRRERLRRAFAVSTTRLKAAVSTRRAKRAIGKWSPRFLPLVEAKSGTVVQIVLLDSDGDPGAAQTVLADLIEACIGQPAHIYQAAMHKLDERAARAHRARIEATQHDTNWSGL